jgi:hypothetical protein
MNLGTHLESRESEKETAVPASTDEKMALSALAQIRFGELRDNLILPTLLRIGERVQSQGVDYQVSTDDFEPFRTTITFHTGRREEGIEARPSLTILFASPFEYVSFQQNDTSEQESSSGGKVGPAGAVAFEDVTEALIENKLLDLLARVL